MANPVWTLSVDLQAKTAVFQSGLADAAKSARGAFQDIKQSSQEMSEGVSKGSLDVRHALGLVDNTIRGAHSMAMVDLIRMFQNTALVMNTLPFAMTVAGFALVAEIVAAGVEHFRALREEEEKLKDAQTELDTGVNEAFNGLNKRLLEAQKQADDLANNHLGAVQKELELIDAESMDTLRKTFDDLSKQADEYFGKLKSHWYEFGTGSAGAQKSLDEFKVQYDSLLAAGEKDKAAEILKVKIDREREILNLQREAASTKGPDYTDTSYAAQIELQKRSIGYTDKEIQSQSTLLMILEKQAAAQAITEKTKKQEGQNVVHREGNEEAARRASAEKAAADSQTRMGEMVIAADRASATAANEIHRASLETRMETDLDFAARERDLKLAGNAADIAALDKSGKDYQNQLKALQDKTLEIQQEYATKTTEIRAKASVEINQRDLTNFEQGEREKIEATARGEGQRVAVLNAAIKEAEARQLQDTEFYRALLTERVQAERQAAEEAAKQKQQIGTEDAQHTERMASLELEQKKTAFQLLRATGRVHEDEQLQQDKELADRESQIKDAALKSQIEALDKNGKEYLVKLKSLQDKETELRKEHENTVNDLEAKAEEARLTRITSAENQERDMIARSLTDVLTRKQSATQAMLSMGDQLAAGMMQNAIKSVLANDYTKESDAAKAARDAFKAAMGFFPPPVNFVMAPVLGAAAFAGVMAFEKGTDMVPGDPRAGDVVHAKLTPGEGVVPGGVMDGLRGMARDGGFNKKPPVHVHVTHAPSVQAFDSTGVDHVLDMHEDKFVNKIEKVVRRLNA